MDVNKGGIGNINYPLVSDLDKSISRAYDVLLGSRSATVLLEDEEKECTDYINNKLEDPLILENNIL